MKRLFFGLLLIFCLTGSSQTYDGMKGRGLYQSYDKSFVSPELRKKHVISLGVQHSMSTPINDSTKFNPGVHLGYNQFFFEKRTRILSAKKKQRDEVKIGFGVHFSLHPNGEWFGGVNIYRPIIALKGTLLSLFLLNEFGLVVHRAEFVPELGLSHVKTNLSFEVFRIRFGRAFFVHAGAFYALRNDLLSKDFKEFSVFGGLRYYFYKK